MALPADPVPDRHDEPLVDLEEIRAAAERLAGVALRTPLLPLVGEERVWLKPESLQAIGAFKIRGAYNAISQLSAEQRAAGVVTASSGNHGQGVARASRLLGTRAVVVMPGDAPALKVERVRADGAEVIRVGPSSDERAEVARRLAAEQGLTYIPSYDDRRIIAGQGTVGLEIVEQLAELGAAGTDVAPSVLVPVGGGGLSSGVATAVRALRPDATILGVEPELAGDAAASFRERRLVRWEPELTTRTMADGLRASSLSALTLRHLLASASGIVTVSEAAIVAAMPELASAARLVAEPSGAVALAGLREQRGSLPDEGPIVVVVSGGNVDPARYRSWLGTPSTVDAPGAAGLAAIIRG